MYHRLPVIFTDNALRYSGSLVPCHNATRQNTHAVSSPMLCLTTPLTRLPYVFLFFSLLAISMCFSRVPISGLVQRETSLKTEAHNLLFHFFLHPFSGSQHHPFFPSSSSQLACRGTCSLQKAEDVNPPKVSISFPTCLPAFSNHATKIPTWCG